jgi:glycosyltransferase involved in cell wall biosynthesis
MEKTNLHCLAVPHTVTHPDYVACAFTQKVLKFLEMFKDHPEYNTIHYGHPSSITSAHEHVNVTSDDVLKQTYGDYDWRKNQFKHSSEDLAHKVFNAWAAKSIIQRKKRGDLVLAFWGGTAEACNTANKDNDLIVVEPGIGSGGAFAKFRCYESHPLKAAFVGTKGVARCYPEWYWRVVPNYFDLRNFAPDLPKEDYALFVGRLGVNKGLDIAIDACKRMGIKLKVAGQGGPDGIGLKEWPDHVEFIGYADMETRKELMGKARLGFLLSTYWEPFGGTAVEMMLSGCVPILSDMGAMTEYCVDGLNGFRCNTMGDILRAIRLVDTIDREKMTKFAQDNFSLDNVRPKFERAFNDFKDIYNGKGWYEDHNRPLNTGLGLNYKALYV